MTSTPFTTCLWFNTEAEEAARYYAGIFKDSNIGRIQRRGSAVPGPDDSVLTVEFELNGQRFLGLNGGPEFQPNQAVSLMVWCDDQAEVDYYWERLSAGGEEIACGWLKDRYGFSWQVVPKRFFELITDPDPERSDRAMAAMMKMTKLDTAALEEAVAAG
jgi:predicted 3-demethylubiquinone-9 3-methyltransferase (glyoxalase superfamily)